MLTFTTLASSSTGNAALVSCGDTHILLDAGISAKRITAGLAELGVKPLARVVKVNKLSLLLQQFRARHPCRTLGNIVGHDGLAAPPYYPAKSGRRPLGTVTPPGTDPPRRAP